MLQHRPRHIAHAVVDAAALALDQGQRLARLEALLQDNATAMGHDRRQRIGRAKRPEQRHGKPYPITRAQMHALADIKAIGDQRPVRQGHPFGRSGGARGVEDVADVLRRHSLLRGSERGCIHRCALHQELRQRENTGERRAADRDDSAQGRKSLGPESPGNRAVELGAKIAQRVEETPAAKGIKRDQGGRTGVLECPGEFAWRRERADRSDEGANLGRRPMHR